jgi:hypothetical protein
VLKTSTVLVVNFSAAPSDAELARAKATTADNFSFMRSIHTVEDDETIRKP